MTRSLNPDFILAGPQKCATTWIYKCLKQHPEVLVPEDDSVHYFDMNYRKGKGWYQDHFTHHNGESIVGEVTPSYVRCSVCPRRIHETVPDTKILFSLRNPIDRAFSHYWHEKEKNKISFQFEEVFTNYDLFQSWIETGQYYRHLQRYRKYFNDEQIGVFLFDNLVSSETDFISDIYQFLGANPAFTPSIIGEKINQAWNRFDSKLLNSIYRRGFDIILKYGSKTIRNALRPFHEAIRKGQIPFIMRKSEYEQGINSETRRRLEQYFISDMTKLSDYINKDLNHWFEHHNLNS